MQQRFQKSSLRNFLLCLACPVLACAVACFVCYGRNIAWRLLQLGKDKHAPLTALQLKTSPQDEEFLQCTFLNITLDIPATMVRDAKIVQGVEGTRWLVFADQIRKIRIPLNSSRAQRTIYGSIPPSIDKLTNTELLAHIYKTGTSDFSIGMSKAQLQEHEWAMTYRDLLGYGMHLTNMAYTTQDDVQLLVLSATTMPSLRRSSGWLAFANWSLSDGSDGGMIYFYDDATGDSNWACRCAESLRRPEVPVTRNEGELEKFIANSTDEGILQMLQIAAGDQ